MIKMEEIFQRLRGAGVFTSKWYHIRLKRNNNELLYRIVVGGRKDVNGRLIRR